MSTSSGTIKTQITLEQPDNIYHGSVDPVQGQVILQYHPSKKNSKQDLYTPLTVSVTFQGRITTRYDPSAKVPSHRGRNSLFSHTTIIFDGKGSLVVGEPKSFAFKLNFPQGTDDFEQQKRWSRDRRFETRPGAPLPPSIFSGRSQSQCLVEYFINPIVQIPGSDIGIAPMDDKAPKDGIPVSFCPLLVQKLPASSTPFEQSTTVFSEDISMGSTTTERQPSGSFFGRNKSPIPPAPVSTHNPSDLTFTISSHAPRYLTLKRRIDFPIYLRIARPLTSRPLPKIHLTSFQFNLTNTTTIRSDQKDNAGRHYETSWQTTAHSTGYRPSQTSLPNPNAQAPTTFSPPTGIFPLGKDALNPNFNSDKPDAVIHIRTSPLKAGPTFKTPNLSRTYTYEITLELEVEGSRAMRISRDFPVVITPPHLMSADGSDIEHGVAKTESDCLGEHALPVQQRGEATRLENLMGLGGSSGLQGASGLERLEELYQIFAFGQATGELACLGLEPLGAFDGAGEGVEDPGVGEVLGEF
ncbi:hypothetical protein MBLNU230_g6027t1 [Neophaeotheca triangularis]